MKFLDYFTNDFETNEIHYIPSLRTRYYRDRIDKVKEVIKEMILKVENGKIIASNDMYNELIVECRKYSATFTIIAPHAGETAVDIKIKTYKTIGFGRGKTYIEEIYKYLDSKLQFKGVSLYKG